MAADLGVALDGGSALQQVHALHDGVHAETAAHLQHGPLQVSLPFQGLKVRKQIQLIAAVVNIQIVGRNVQAADEQAVIHLLLEGGHQPLQDQRFAVGGEAQAHGAVGVLGVRPAVIIQRHGAAVIGVCVQGFGVKGNRPGQHGGFQVLIHQVGAEQVGHFLEHQQPFLVGIGPGQHLACVQAAVIGLVVFDIAQARGLDAPGVVDEQLRVDAEQVVEIALVGQRHGGHVAHGVQAAALQRPGRAGADVPEIRQRAVGPEQQLVVRFVQLGDAHAVLVGGFLLRHDVHAHLRQVQVRADAHGGSDAGGIEHVTDHGHGHQMRRGHALPLGFVPIQVQVGRGVDEYLVDGINVNVFFGNIPQIDFVDLGADPDVFRHARRGDDVIHLGMGGGFVEADFFLGLEQARAAGHADGLQRRAHGQADGLVRAALVRHQQPRRQRVQMPGVTLHAGIKAL